MSRKKSSLLLPLIARLKACPSLNNNLSKKLLGETWDCFKQVDPEHGEITPAVMAGLVLHDEEQFAKLLSNEERSQLVALANKALEQYRQITNPPNKLGKTIAATLKEST